MIADNTQAGATVQPARTARSGLRRVADVFLILFMSVFWALVVLELALRVLFPRPSSAGLFVPDALARYRNAPNLHEPSPFGDGTFLYNTNGQGLREATEVGAASADTLRVLSVGDSFAFGFGVEMTQTYTSLLSGTLLSDGRRLTTVNTGVPGYGPNNEAAWLHAYGWAYQPQIVLLGFFIGNDMSDVMLGLDRVEVDDEGHMNQNPRVAQLPGGTDFNAPTAGVDAWLNYHSRAYEWLRSRYQDLFAHKMLPTPPPWNPAALFLDPTPAAVQDGWAQTLAVLDQIRADTVAHGARLVLVGIPPCEQVLAPCWDARMGQFSQPLGPTRRDAPQQVLAAWSVRTGTPFVDLLPAFATAAKTQQLYFNHDVHWTPAGHALAAQEIRAAFARLGLLH